MPVGYLISVAFMLWLAFFALVAPRRPWILAWMSFTFGLVINEVPFLAFLWLVASTVLLFAQGDVDSPGAWVAVGLMMCAVVALAVIFARALRTRPVVVAALRDGLGAAWHGDLDNDSGARWARLLLSARLLIAPWWIPRLGVQKVRNIQYGPDTRHNRLDVYRRRSAPRGRPVLVYFHGGGTSAAARRGRRSGCSIVSPAKGGCASVRTIG